MLVVDDDASYLMILERLCSSCGAEVITASTADQARAALATQQFDLMLFDLQLPRQEGLALIAEVEEDPVLAPKAVVVTGFASVAPVFTRLPVIDKSSLHDLGVFLRDMLTRGETTGLAC
jgi:two-component system response regulator RegA